MPVPMVNIIACADTLDRVAKPAIVDRALCPAGLDAPTLKQGDDLPPYALETRAVEQVARAPQASDLGARLAHRRRTDAACLPNRGARYLSRIDPLRSI